MPGYRIDIDTSGGRSNIDALRQSMDALAQQTKQTAEQMAQWNVRMAKQDVINGVAGAVRAYGEAVENLARAQGVCSKEAQALGEKAEQMARDLQKANSELSKTSNAASSASTALALVEKVAIRVAAAFATYKVADYVKDATMLAARYGTLGVVMETVGANAGYTAGEMNATAKALQKTGISMVESRQQATRLVQAHLELSNATKLARLAQDAAVIAGENSSITFSKIVYAIQSAQPEILRTIGLNVDFQSSYKKLADKLHTTASALSKNEKMQARFNAVMEKAPDIAGVYERAMGTAGKALLSFQRYNEDFKVMLGQAFGPALQQFVDQATASMKAFQDEISRPEAQAALGAMANGAAQLGTNLMRSAIPALDNAVKALNDIVTAWQKIPAPLQGVLLGGSTAALLSRGNLWATGAGALYGMMEFGDAANAREVAAGLARAKNLASTGTNEVRMKVALVGPDGKPLQKTLKKRLEEISYSAADSQKLLGGGGTAKYQLDNAWEKNLGIISQLQRKIDSGRLSQEDMTRALDDQKEAWGRIGQAQESYQKRLDSTSRSESRAAEAAMRYQEAASAFYDQTLYSLDQLQDSLSGGSEKNVNRVDKWFEQQFDRIRKAVVGAKGDVSQYAAAWVALWDAWPGSRILAVVQDTSADLEKQSRLLHSLASSTGDPGMVYAAGIKSAEVWREKTKTLIEQVYDDEQERLSAMQALQDGYNKKLIQAKADAYASIKSVSSKYWTAEKELLQQHLATVKKNADDETAYKIYAAQQWDEYNKKALENQAQYGGSFSDVFAAKWSLAFGSYRNDLSKAHKDWESFSDDVIDLAQGMGDAIAGSWGDAIRSILSGKGDISDLGKNMVSRMVDSLAVFVEKSMKRSWNDMLGQLFGGSATDLAQTQAVTAQAASVTASSADMSISSATINISSASVSGASGRDILSGSSGTDRLDDFGKTAGTSFADTLKQQTANDGGFVFGTSQGLETLVGGLAPIWQRYNNPGNMRTKGGDWASFSDMATGLQPMVSYLKRRIDQGYDTIEKMKNIYAEGSQTWAQNVSQGSGLGRNTLLVSGNADTLQRLARGVTVAEGSSKAISDELLYKLTHGSLATEAGAKAFAKSAGPAMGASFYDELSSQTSTDTDGGIVFSAQGVESLKGAEDALGASSHINWKGLGAVLGGVSQLAMGAGSGNVGSMIGGGISTVGGLMSTFGTAGSLMSTIGGYAGILGTVVSVVATLLSSSTKTEKTGSGYNVAINAGKVQLAGVDFYRTTTTQGYSTSTSHTASPGVTDPDVGREISLYLRDAAKNLKRFGEELGISVEALKDFSAPMQTITKDSISIYERNMSNLQAQVVVTAEGLRGAFDYVADDEYEIYVDEFKRLATAYKTVGGYAEAYGYDLETMAGVTDAAIAAIRQYNEESYKTAQDTLPAVWAALGATGDQLSSLTQTLQEQADVAAAVSDEQYSTILQANYADKLIQAVGDEETFKQVMESLIQNVLDDLEAYQAQAQYYTKKSNAAIADLNVAGVTIENFWESFSAAMSTALSPDQFELWADASSWVNNLNTMDDAIEQWQNNIRKINQDLEERNLTAAGLDTAASAAKQLADAEWELYEARKANYDAATIAAIEETQRLEKLKALSDVMDEVQSELDDTLGNGVASELRDLYAKFADWIAAAQTLGASEQQLATIREQEAKIIAGKLSNLMDDIREELSTYDGTELTYTISSLKKELAGKLFDAALLGATEADLTNIGTLYAYKVKEAYQNQIDDIVDQLQDAADALDNFSSSIGDFLDELWRGDDSPLSLGERYAEARKQWQEAVTNLSSPDDKVRDAARDNIQGLTTDYLDLSKQYNADFAAYYADFMDVQGILGDQYEQAKSEYDLLQDQLDAAKGTEENTKTTAELLDELHSLQQQQGDTWAQMLADLPQAIAAAILKAQEYKDSLKQTASSGGGGLDQALADLNAQWGGYYTAAQQANSQYLADKAAQMTAETGKTWTVQQVLAAINDAGLTPFQHYQRYGEAEGLTWSDSNAFSDTNYAYTVGGFDSSGWNADHTMLSFLDPSDYLKAKADQLTATTGRAWTVQEVAKALADAGLTAAQHYDLYGRHEGIGAGSGYTGGPSGGWDNAAYLAAKTAELNATQEGGHSWTVAETAAAIAAAGLTPQEHYRRYGQYEGIPGYAEGGYIPGYSDHDVMLAKLRLGEFVMTPEAVQHYGVDLMDALNARALPRESLRGYADGGPVLDDGFVSRQNRALDTALGGGSSSSDEVVALRKEVAELREVVAKMAAKTDKQLDKLVTNSNSVVMRGVKLQEATT